MKFFLTSFLVCLGTLAFAQKGVAVDYHKIIKNVSIPDEVPEAAREMILKSLTKPKTFVLLSDGSKSVFTEESRSEKKIIEDKKEEGTSSVQNISIMSGSSVLFKDFDKNKIIESTSLGLDQVLYERDIPVLNWTILEEFLEIEGVKCQKAVLGDSGSDNYKEAWFAVDIPISDGPYFFCGLPGLILKVESTTISFEVKRIKFEDKLSNIEAPTNGKKISYEDYEKKLDEIKKKPVRVTTKTVGPPQKRL